MSELINKRNMSVGENCLQSVQLDNSNDTIRLNNMKEV